VQNLNKIVMIKETLTVAVVETASRPQDVQKNLGV
jgi:hypothetical protein